MVLSGCGALDPPQQVTAAGLAQGKQLAKPCPGWCQVDGQIRALSDDAGTPKAFEVTLPAANWAAVLDDVHGKWGSPDATYFVDRATNPDTTAWNTAADAKHRSHMGAAAGVLRRGDSRHNTDYAVWSQGGTLIRVSNSKAMLRAAWVDLGML
jgi:hypothetical protein